MNSSTTTTTNTSVTTNNNKKFTIDLTKTELDAIHKQFLEELDGMLDKVRNRRIDYFIQ